MNVSQSLQLLQQVDILLCGLLKGEKVPWENITFAQQAVLLDRINFHGVQTMIWTDVQHSNWPVETKAQLHEASLAIAGRELGHMHALGKVLRGLDEAKVAHILFKGTALAYTIYSNPVHRIRSDTDILVSEQDRTTATTILEASGFTACSSFMELLYYQQTWRLETGNGGQHAIDLHWRFNNSELLAGLFGIEELLARADTAVICGMQVKIPCKSDAVLIACLHKAVHDFSPYWVDGRMHLDGARLIWLYDLHLLISHFRVQDWNDLAEQAAAKGLGHICAAVLEEVREKFGTVMFLEGLEMLSGDSKGRATRYLDSSQAGRMWMDLCACQGWREKFLYAKKVFFPSEAYMRHKYANDKQWLPILYLRRTLGGIFRHAPADSHQT